MAVVSVLMSIISDAYIFFSSGVTLGSVALGVWNGVCAIATAITGAFGSVVAFLTSPITPTIIAIGLLIAAIILMIKYWDDIKAAAIACWDWIVDAWNKAGPWFENSIINPIKEFFGFFII